MADWGQLNERGAKVFPCHKGQSEVLRSDARFTAALAGTGGGKTVTGPLWMIRQIKKHIDRGTGEAFLGMICAPTYQILSRATVPVFVETLRGTALEGTYSEAKKRYYLPNGLGVIWTVSADNPNGMEGGQYDAAWLDEGGQMSRQAWIAIQGRTGMKQGPIFITTTLYRLNWIKKEIISRFRAGDPNYLVVSWRSIENPRYPRDEYDRAKERLPSALFGMRYDGVYPEDDQIVFSSYDFDVHVRPCQYDNTLPIFVGCNFESNPMSFVLAHPRPLETLEVFDELSVRDTTTQKMLGMLWEQYGLAGRRAAHVGPWRFFGDATSRTTWRTSAALSDYQTILNDRRFGADVQDIVAPDSAPAFIDRVAATNARFEGVTGKRCLFIDPRCRGLITDLESRFYEETERKAKRPEDVEDAGPLSDALSFLVFCLFPLLDTPGGGPVLFGPSKRKAPERIGATR